MQKKQLWWNDGVSKKYTPLKYLLGDGNSWIDTNYIANSSCKMEIAFTPVSTTNTSNICGTVTVTNNNESDRFQIICHADTKKIGIGMGSSFITYGAAGTIDMIENKTYVIGMYIPTRRIRVNGDSVTPTSGSNWTQNVSEKSIYIFNVNGTSSARGASIIRIHSFRLFDNNVLVRDMIPALDNNGTPCMWDRVTDTPYYNQGSGTFKYALLDYIPCTYLKADGNAGFKAYLIANSTTAFDIKFRTDTEESLMVVAGARNNETETCSCLCTSTPDGQIVVDFGNYAQTRLNPGIGNINKSYYVRNSKNQRYIKDFSTDLEYTQDTEYTSDFATTEQMTLALTGNGFTSSMKNFIGDIYMYRIYQDGAPVRDYIPVIGDNNIAGMYDRCLNIVFYSTESSQFEGHFVMNDGTDYTALKALESLGSQYIDMEFSLNAGDINEFWVDFCWTRAEPGKALNGQYNSTANQRSGYLYSGPGGSDSYVKLTGGGNDLFTPIKTSAITNERLYWHCCIDDTAKRRTVYDLENNIIVTDTYQGYITASKQYLFALYNTTKQAASEFSYAKIYRFKQSVNNQIIRNYIPVLRTGENSWGLLDIVEKKYYVNKGSGRFTYE